VKGNNGEVITLQKLADFDMRQTDSAIEYIKKHAKDAKPFFMDVNFMKMHQPTSPNKVFQGKSHLGNYSDSLMELDYNVGRIMDEIRAEDAGHDCHLHRRQWGLAGRMAQRRDPSVSRRKGFSVRGRLARSGHHVGAG